MVQLNSYNQKLQFTILLSGRLVICFYCLFLLSYISHHKVSFESLHLQYLSVKKHFEIRHLIAMETVPFSGLLPLVGGVMFHMTKVTELFYNQTLF